MLPPGRGPEELEDWREAVSHEVRRISSEEPVRWGGQYEIEGGYHLSTRQLLDLVGTPNNIELFLALENGCPAEKVSRTMGDARALSAIAQEACEADGAAIYYTDVEPADYTAEELIGLAGYRLDLFRHLSPERAESIESVVGGRDGRALTSIAAWFCRVDDELWNASKDDAACWGWQYRMESGRWVSEEDFDKTLQTELERDAYLVVANEGISAELLKSANDAAALSLMATRAVESGAVFGTELYMEDFYPDELRSLASERPELFSSSDIEAAEIPDLLARELADISSRAVSRSPIRPGIGI